MLESVIFRYKTVSQEFFCAQNLSMADDSAHKHTYYTPRQDTWQLVLIKYQHQHLILIPIGMRISAEAENSHF